MTIFLNLDTIDRFEKNLYTASMEGGSLRKIEGDELPSSRKIIIIAKIF